jgi:hypothetical protein
MNRLVFANVYILKLNVYSFAQQKVLYHAQHCIKYWEGWANMGGLTSVLRKLSYRGDPGRPLYKKQLCNKIPAK